MAASLNPKNPVAFHTRARSNFDLHNQIGDIEKFERVIISDINKALSLDPQNSQYRQDAVSFQELFAQAGQARQDIARAEALRREEQARQEVARQRAEAEASRRRWMIGLAAVAALAAAAFALALFFFRRRREVKSVSAQHWSGFAPSGQGERPPDQATPQVIGGSFQILRPIGQGGMGVVYEAYDAKLNRRVALKRLSESLRTDPDERRRLMAEAQTVASLKHANIMTLYSVADEGELYLVCEFLAGETVADLILRKGRLLPHECLAIIKDICAALAYAHKHGVIHLPFTGGNARQDALEGKFPAASPHVQAMPRLDDFFKRAFHPASALAQWNIAGA